jgi:ribosomal protein S1
MDNLATLSAKESVVSASALSYADLVPGEMAEGTVSKVLDRGVVVDLGGGLKGFVGPLHLSGAAGAAAGSTKKFKVSSWCCC